MGVIVIGSDKGKKVKTEFYRIGNEERLAVLDSTGRTIATYEASVLINPEAYRIRHGAEAWKRAIKVINGED